MTDIVVEQGTDPDIRIRNVRDANGALITNWSGFSVKGQIRERVASATVLHEWTSQGVGANVSFSDSDIVLSLPHGTSTAWAWTTARYDIELTDPAGKVVRLAEGFVIVDREVTR